MHDMKSRIASIVKRRRVVLGLTCADVDRRARLCLGHTASIERGARSQLAIDTVKALALALDLTVDDLIG